MKPINQILIITTLLAVVALSSRGQEDLPFRVEVLEDSLQVNCLSGEQSIGITIDNWIPGIQYLWSTGETDSMIFVQPQTTTTYFITVSHPNYTGYIEKSVLVTQFNTPIVVDDKTYYFTNQICPNDDVTLKLNTSGGVGNLSYLWSNGASNKQITVKADSGETFYVSVTDECGTTSVGKALIFREPQIKLIAPESLLQPFNCSNEEIELIPDLNLLIGGIGRGYKFSFDSSVFSNAPLLIYPDDGKRFNVYFTDECEIQISKSEIILLKENIKLPELNEFQMCSGDTFTFDQNELPRTFIWDEGQLFTQYQKVYHGDAIQTYSYFDECQTQHQIQRSIVISAANSDFDVTNLVFSDKIVAKSIASDNSSYTWIVNERIISQEKELEIILDDSPVIEITLIITNEFGCTSETTRKYIPRDGVDIPTAFSPNGDGINDVFKLNFSEPLNKFEIKIFNRWGQLIYKSNDQYFEWDGIEGNPQNLPTTFAYSISGISNTGNEFQKNGTITLTRTK